jgi:hypothetical protein
MPGSVTYPAQPTPPEQQVPMPLRYEERVPNQRPQGTVYGSRPSQPAIEPGTGSPEAPPGRPEPGQLVAEGSAPDRKAHGSTGPLPYQSFGALTGHTLAEGRPDEARPHGHRAAIGMLVAVAVLGVAASLGSILVLTGAF